MDENNNNFDLSINLLNLKNSFIKELVGKTTSKRCLIIPIDDNFIFEGKAGAYINVSMKQQKENTYGNSHYLRLKLTKENYDSLSIQEKNEIPFLGNAKPAITFYNKNSAISENNDFLNTDNIDDDLPF